MKNMKDKLVNERLMVGMDIPLIKKKADKEFVARMMSDVETKLAGYGCVPIQDSLWYVSKPENKDAIEKDIADWMTMFKSRDISFMMATFLMATDKDGDEYLASLVEYYEKGK